MFVYASQSYEAERQVDKVYLKPKLFREDMQPLSEGASPSLFV